MPPTSSVCPKSSRSGNDSIKIWTEGQYRCTQIAVIKKQKEAAMSAEYAEGGFTPDGPKKKVVGVVHAGEWIASQKLVKSPVARPLLEALEVAQRG